MSHFMRKNDREVLRLLLSRAKLGLYRTFSVLQDLAEHPNSGVTRVLFKLSDSCA